MKIREIVNEMIANEGTTTALALKLYDSLEPVTIDQMIGRWAGTEIPTNHPMDGLLKVTGWYGKMFADKENAYPLVFWTADKKGLYAVDPKHIPLDIDIPKTDAIGWLTGLIRPVLETIDSKARLRMVEHRGKVSAAMCYDEKPIIDCFRKIDDNTVMGVMDQKGRVQPYFFMLERDDDSSMDLHF